MIIWLLCSYAQVAAVTFTAVSLSPPRLAHSPCAQSRTLWHKVSVRMNEDTAGGGRRARKKQEFARRREAWLARYGSASALQSTFGTGPPLGDLSPEQTRSLYHRLLPRSLLGLHEMGLMRPEELAHLAYEARIAAKEYARSRCVVSGRLMTAAFDQYRSLRDHGRPAVGSGSMSWEEVWQKYEGQIVQEECAAALNRTDTCAKREEQGREALSVRIYLRILERSCATNKAFDSLFLKESAATLAEDSSLAAMAEQLDEDVRAILLGPRDGEKARRTIEKAQRMQRDRRKKEQKTEERSKSKLRKEWAKAEMRRQKAEMKEEREMKEREERQERQKQKVKKTEEQPDEHANCIAAKANTESTADEAEPNGNQRRDILRVLGRARQFRSRLSGRAG
jgi:hypothetical protein